MQHQHELGRGAKTHPTATTCNAEQRRSTQNLLNISLLRLRNNCFHAQSGLQAARQAGWKQQQKKEDKQKPATLHEMASKSFRFHIPPTQRTHRKYASHRHERYCTSINDAAARRASCTALVRSILFHARLRAVRRLHRITSARPHRSNAAPMHTKRAKEENTDKKTKARDGSLQRNLKRNAASFDGRLMKRSTRRSRPARHRSVDRGRL